MPTVTRPSLTPVDADGNPGTTIEFITFDGRLQRFSQSPRDITRPGTDGSAFRKEGKRAEPSKYMAIRDCSDDESGDLKQSVADLKSTLCSLVDGFGGTADSVMVLDVKLADEKRTGGGVGGIADPSERLLTWEIILQRTIVPTP